MKAFHIIFPAFTVGRGV